MKMKSKKYWEQNDLQSFRRSDYDIWHPGNDKSDKFEVSADIFCKPDDHCSSRKSDLVVAPLCKPDTPIVRAAYRLFLSGTFSPDFHPVRRSLFFVPCSSIRGWKPELLDVDRTALPDSEPKQLREDQPSSHSFLALMLSIEIFKAKFLIFRTNSSNSNSQMSFRKK